MTMVETDQTQNVESRPLNQKYWLTFGAVFSFMIFVLVMVTFFAPENSCDRWTILRFVLPIFSGIAAGAFVGAITAQGSVYQLAVAATGGFAVWLITLLLVGVPPRCQEARLLNFRPIETANAVKENGKWLPVNLNRKSGPYDFSDVSRSPYFFVS